MGTCLGKTLQEDWHDLQDGNYLTLPDNSSRRGGIRVTSVHRLNDYTQTFPKLSPSCSSTIPQEDETSYCDYSTVSRDQYLQHAVESFQYYIIETIKVHDLVPLLGDFIDEGICHSTHINKREAARCLINALTYSRVKGRWQAFMDALQAAGYPYLVRLINGHTDQDQNIRTKLLKLYQRQLIENIYLDTFLDKLFERHILHEPDVQEIRSERDNRGENAAILMMLDSIPRREEHWFESFVEILRENGMDYIAEEIDEVDLKPPPRCSPPSAQSSLCLTPPPGYTENTSRHAHELEKNENKIRRLQRERDEKRKLISTRTEIIKLKESHKQLDEELETVQKDDSGSERDWNSDSDSDKVNLDIGCANPAYEATAIKTAFYASSPQSENEFDAKQIQHRLSVEHNSEIKTEASIVQEKTSILKSQKDISSSEDPENERSKLTNELIKTLTKSVEDLIAENKSLKENVIRLNDRVDERFNRLSDHLNIPPAPHNMHPVDSAFSDGSIISITSF